MTSASQACGSMSFNFAVPMMEYMKAARCPPRSDPAKSQDFLPRATPLSERSAALLLRLRLPARLGNRATGQGRRKPLDHLL